MTHNPNEDDYYLQRMLPHTISDNIFCPGEPPKPRNIGVVLVKRVHPSDNSYGTHFAKYGGIGYEKIDHPDFVFPARRLDHVRTGVDCEIPETPSERNRQSLVKKNKAFYSQPLNEVGTELFTLHRTTASPKQENIKAKKENVLFPTSSIYDYDNIRLAYFNELKRKQEATDKVNEALKKFEESAMNRRKPSQCTPGSLLKLDCKDFEKEFQKDRHTPDPWWPNPPYWYDPNKTGAKPIPPRNINAYSTSVPCGEIEGQNWLEEMELDNTQNYLPGEIYKNNTPKLPVENLSKSGGCNKQWKPRVNVLSGAFDVDSIPFEQSLSNEVEERRNMNYSESLDIFKPTVDHRKKQETSCSLKDKKKISKAQMCSCGACKCTLDPEIGIFVPDVSQTVLDCGCVKCHINKYRKI